MRAVLRGKFLLLTVIECCITGQFLCMIIAFISLKAFPLKKTTNDLEMIFKHVFLKFSTGMTS